MQREADHPLGTPAASQRNRAITRSVSKITLQSSIEPDATRPGEEQ